MNGLEPVRRLPFHELGTLTAFTRWIVRHEDGIAELIKNVRAAYQEERANVIPSDRCAVLLFRDPDKYSPARLGILDVGGLTFDDVKRWSLWNDPEASSRGNIRQEETQGNGGKAYMYRLFKGPSYILGVKNNHLNQGGFLGDINTVERGLPRFYPTSIKEIWEGSNLQENAKEKDIPRDWKEEIVKQLRPFKTDFASLPLEVKKSLENRKAFTIVVGEDPIDWDTNVKQVIKRLLHHPQAILPIQQIRFYVIHNGKVLPKGEPIELEEIEPYPGFEKPLEYEIPEVLLAPNGNQVNTTKSSSGKHEKGRITIYTSKDSMESSYRTLRPRWVVTYKTKYEVVGQKSIPDIVPATPGSHFVYATIQLDSLSPESVGVGRKRPNDTYLVLAVDRFLAEKIKEVAKKINDLQKRDISESILDEIEKENEFLNKLKNEFLPAGGIQDLSTVSGVEGTKRKREWGPITYGIEPKEIKVNTYFLRIAKGVSINLTSVLYPTVRDINDKPVNIEIKWKSDGEEVIKLDDEGNCMALEEGESKIYLYIPKTKIVTPPILIEVVLIKDVFLSPKDLKVGVGHNKQITAQVITDDNKRFTDVLLDWKHDASKQSLIKISPRGYVFGNEIGKTSVTAGANFNESSVYATDNVAVEIVKSDDKGEHGSGFPTLKITDRDIDPYDGKKRLGDPEAPALWQEYWDVKKNIWWLNMQSKDVQFAAEQSKSGNKQLWRLLRAKILVEMVIQVHMQHDYTMKGEEEKPSPWSDHKFYYDRKYVEIVQSMWDRLATYITGEVEF